jgi:hypothetical protein
MGEIIATDYIERESCGILLAILYLDFYVWAMLLYMMMSQLHHANVIPGMSTVHDDVTFTSC